MSELYSPYLKVLEIFQCANLQTHLPVQVIKFLQNIKKQTMDEIQNQDVLSSEDKETKDAK
jgi:hypothetical protein